MSSRARKYKQLRRRVERLKQTTFHEVRGQLLFGTTPGEYLAGIRGEGPEWSPDALFNEADLFIHRFGVNNRRAERLMARFAREVACCWGQSLLYEYPGRVWTITGTVGWVDVFREVRSRKRRTDYRSRLRRERWVGFDIYLVNRQADLEPGVGKFLYSPADGFAANWPPEWR